MIIARGDETEGSKVDDTMSKADKSTLCVSS